ncbi:MAG: hypothetical protein F8N37_05700 [Telmatospirillum sp.]|nr:hypothetical protein [Telmatospirillum sp.]
MPSSNVCHLRSWLVAIAEDLESADTLKKLEHCLNEQEFVWRRLNGHCQFDKASSLEIKKFSEFVLSVLRDNVYPDDQRISELAAVNVRASRLLGGHCPCRDSGCLCRMTGGVVRSTSGYQPMERAG